RWDMAGWMWAGAMPAAFAGALLANATAPQWIEAAIGVLAAVTGLHAWRSSGAAKRRGREPVQRVEPESRQALPKPTLAVVGAFTGVTSALTGTGGPLVLMPILVSLEVPLLAALGLAQAIQLPIAVLATAGNVAVGALDVATGALLGA